MKRYHGLLSYLVALLLINCTADSGGNGSTSNTVKWSYKLDGVLYSWQGNSVASLTNDGTCTYVTSSGTNPTAGISFGSPSSGGFRTVTGSISLPNTNTGNFYMNENSTNCGFTLNSGPNIANIDVLSSGLGGQMTVHIESISPNSILNSGISGAGKVIGTFSGTIYSATSHSLKTITEGSFEAIRNN